MGRLVRAVRISRRAARKLAPVLLACALAVALVFGGLRSGAHYFFCAGMGTLAEKPCCAPAEPADAPDESAARAGDGDDDCCQRLDLGRLPESAAGRMPEPIRSAPLLAVLAPVDAATSAVRQLARLHQWELGSAARGAGESPPPTAPERCALQGVFLI